MFENKLQLNMRSYRRIMVILLVIVCGIWSKLFFYHTNVQSHSHTTYEVDSNYEYNLSGVKRNVIIVGALIDKAVTDTNISHYGNGTSFHKLNTLNTQRVSMRNDRLNTQRISIRNANQRHSDTAYFVYLHGLPESLTVIARSIVYYDDRPHLPDTPCLRFYFVYQVSITDEFWNSLRFFITEVNGIKVNHPDKISILRREYAKVKPRTRKINNQDCTQGLVTVPLKTNINNLPTSVLITSRIHTHLNQTFPVYISKSENPVNFSVCVQPLYGKMDNEKIDFFIEWIEAYKEFGVSEFHIYNESLIMTNRLERVLDYYNGTVIIHQFTINVRVRPVMTARPAYLDCICKNYKRVNYLLILDLDEILVPRIHSNYDNLLNHVILKDPTYKVAASVPVRQQMFYKIKPDLSEKLYILQNRLRVEPFLGGYCKKSFINPKYCVLAFHHYCILTPPVHYITKEISHDLAFVHHYRDRRQSSMDKPLHDNVMIKFKPQIEKQVLMIVNETLTQVKDLSRGVVWMQKRWKRL